MARGDKAAPPNADPTYPAGPTPALFPPPPPPSPPPGAVAAPIQQEAADRATAAHAQGVQEGAAQGTPPPAKKKKKGSNTPFGIFAQIQRRLDRLPTDKARHAVVVLLSECYPPSPAKE